MTPPDQGDDIPMAYVVPPPDPVQECPKCGKVELTDLRRHNLWVKEYGGKACGHYETRGYPK